MKINQFSQVGQPPITESIGRIAQKTATPSGQERSTAVTETQQSTANTQQIDPMAEHQQYVKELTDLAVDHSKQDEAMLDASIKQANKSLSPYNRFIDREVHAVTKTVMYTIKDKTTGDVIAEFPPKKIQDMIAKMWELAGLFVDEKA